MSHQQFVNTVQQWEEWHERHMPTQERLRELLNYDPETGKFSWKPRAGCVVGKELGTDNGNGYLRITVDGSTNYAHRLAWVYMHGDIPEEQIDHINGDKADNRISNLRPATPSANSRNRQGAQVNSQSGVLGVSWHAKSGKWQVHKHGKYIGLFSEQSEAIVAWEKA